MKRLLSVLAIILFGGIGMAGAQPRCEQTGGTTWKVNEIVNYADGPAVKITLQHHKPYEVTVHFYILYKGEQISGEQIENIPAYKDGKGGSLNDHAVYVWETKDKQKGNYSVKITQDKKCN